MNIEEILLAIAPGVDAFLAKLLDILAWPGKALGLAALWQTLMEWLGGWFAGIGFSMI